MKVPLLDLKKEFSVVESDVRSAIDRVLESQMFILGPEVQAFEKQVADYAGAKFAIGVSSGTDALVCSLMALEVGPGDEVITTPFTFFATAGAIARPHECIIQAAGVIRRVEPVVADGEEDAVGAGFEATAGKVGEARPDVLERGTDGVGVLSVKPQNRRGRRVAAAAHFGRVVRALRRADLLAQSREGVEDRRRHPPPAAQRPFQFRHKVELSRKLRLVSSEDGQARQVGDASNRAGGRIAVVVHHLEKIEIVSFDVIEMDPQGRLPADLVGVEMIPEADRCAIRSVVRHGRAAEQIVKFATEERQDVIMLGAPTRRRFTSALFGETTELVLRHAPVPVLVLPRPA